jgi:hypothetical protein
MIKLLRTIAVFSVLLAPQVQASPDSLAQAELAKMLPIVAPGASVATLEAAIPLWVITPAAADSSSFNLPAGLAATAKAYLYPVVTTDGKRYLLRLEHVGGAWQGVGLGYQDLANELPIVLQVWPRAKLKLVEHQASHQHLFHVKGEKLANLTALLFNNDTQDSTVLKKKYTTLGDAADVIQLDNGDAQ